MAFEKGKSGNPGGRPKEAAEVKALAKEHTKEAIDRLVFWMRSDESRTSVAAAQTLLDRGHGKPSQAITGPDDGPLDIRVIEMVIVRE